jgi:Predicted NADH:ubiquinone oxidoreductase, subunit RnfB
MSGILFAVISVTAVGLVCAVVLAVASIIMATKEDERFPDVREALPGVNCGACGYSGCDEYAKALLEGGDVKTNLCTPGGDTVSKKLGDFLGVGFHDVIEEVAVIKCRGDCNATRDKMEYHGTESCAAAKLLFGGIGVCTLGCMGLGDCMHICPSNAICIEKGIAHINTRACTGCGMCARTCPNHLISLMPDTRTVLVTCSNTEKGAVTHKKCLHGCIACHKCEKECPTNAISIIDNLAEIDHDVCIDCGRCAEVCPTTCIMWGDFTNAVERL